MCLLVDLIPKPCANTIDGLGLRQAVRVRVVSGVYCVIEVPLHHRSGRQWRVVGALHA